MTSCLRHQNPEKSGLNAHVATNGHTYIVLQRNSKCVCVWLLQRMRHTVTSLWHLFFNFCFDTLCDSWCVCFIYITLVLRCESGPYLSRLYSCNMPFLWYFFSLKVFKLSKTKMCIFTLPSPIFHFTPYVGKSEKCAEVPKILNIYEIINDHFLFYTENYWQRFCKSKLTKYCIYI
jgi:hypothetical protein